MSTQVITREQKAAATGVQAPRHVVMVRPHRFMVNPATASDNAFQGAAHTDASQAAKGAYADATRLAEALRQEGIAVSLFEDKLGLSPDSVFPNNWFTTHPDGRIVLCPMYAANRREERRDDIIEHLRDQFGVTEILDWTAAEQYNQFLEGTGSVVIDHTNRVAYGCRSHRLTAGLFTRFCRQFGLQPVIFDAVDASGTPVFHTNVLMSVGEKVALVASSMIQSPTKRDEIRTLLGAGGRTVVELDEAQVKSFAGNALELTGSFGPVLAMSTTAEAALRADQLAALSNRCRILPVDVSTVETSGGSVRCMLAGIHLPPAVAHEG